MENLREDTPVQPDAPVRWTPIQQRMLEVLADGMPHRAEELHLCLNDTDGEIDNVRAHLTHMRKKLRPRGQDIICEWYNRGFYYRHVRLISKSE